jgi:hypothetical protein
MLDGTPLLLENMRANVSCRQTFTMLGLPGFLSVLMSSCDKLFGHV